MVRPVRRESLVGFPLREAEHLLGSHGRIRNHIFKDNRDERQQYKNVSIYTMALPATPYTFNVRHTGHINSRLYKFRTEHGYNEYPPRARGRWSAFKRLFSHDRPAAGRKRMPAFESTNIQSAPGVQSPSIPPETRQWPTSAV